MRAVREQQWTVARFLCALPPVLESEAAAKSLRQVSCRRTLLRHRVQMAQVLAALQLPAAPAVHAATIPGIVLQERGHTTVSVLKPLATQSPEQGRAGRQAGGEAGKG